MEKLTKEELTIAYNMCGTRPINAEFTTDIFNSLLNKGGEFSLKDAAEIRTKHENNFSGFKPNHNRLRVFYRNNRHKRI